MNLSEEYEKHKNLVFTAIYSLFKSHKRAVEVAQCNYCEFDDLVQIGNYCLLRCIENNNNEGASFAHYAITSIKKEIINVLRFKGSLIRVPHGTNEPKKIFLSSDYKVSEDGPETFIDFLPVKTNVENLVINKITLEEKLNTLNERYRTVIHYKLQGLEDMEIAELLGTTNKAISLIVHKALKKLNPEGRMQRRLANEFKELYEKGYSQEEIMRKLQINGDRYRNYKWRYKKAIG